MNAAESIVPLVDLRAQYATVKTEVDAAVEGVLARGDFILGKELKLFEAEFAQYCGAKFGVGVGSGTDALHLACRALDIGPGDEVIMPAFTFVATALGISLAGATPMLVDVDPRTALIDAEAVARAVRPRPAPSCRFIFMVNVWIWIHFSSWRSSTDCALSRTRPKLMAP